MGLGPRKTYNLKPIKLIINVVVEHPYQEKQYIHVGSAALFCHITDWIADCEPEYINKSLAFPIFLTDNRKQG